MEEQEALSLKNSQTNVLEVEEKCGQSKLILLRGNSGSGKSTIAKRLQQELGRGTLYIPQDVVRREMLWVREQDEKVERAVLLMMEMLQFGSQHCEYTILEGILTAEKYREVFLKAKECFGTLVFAYYFDLPIEETLKRHETKPNRNDFGESKIREWFHEKDFTEVFQEKIITKEEQAEDIISRILTDLSQNNLR